MKRMLCVLLALMMLLSLGAQAFADDDVLFCRICGRQIPVDSNVCPYCGEKVVHVTANGAGTVSTADAKPSAAEVKLTSGAAETKTVEATDVKTALSQLSAPSPVTQSAQAEVPGPFNTTLGGSASAARVRVTKSPTSESVPYGGSCMFIAHAANASSVTWYIANGDASLITLASDAPNNVAGLYVSGANTDTLYLSGIPSWMNGCQVQACFTGEGGPVYTETARIWTYQPETQYDTSGWTWWDWFNYYYWDDPYSWDFPWWYWLDWDDDAPNPPDVDHAITLPGGPSVAPEKPGPGFIYAGEEAEIISHTHEPGPDTQEPGGDTQEGGSSDESGSSGSGSTGSGSSGSGSSGSGSSGSGSSGSGSSDSGSSDSGSSDSGSSSSGGATTPSSGTGATVLSAG